MSFKPKTISLEESKELREVLAESVHVEVKETKDDLRGTDEAAPKRNEGKGKKKQPKVSTSRTAELESKIKQSDIDYGKWTNFKRITLNKPDITLQEEETKTVVVPVSLLERMNEISKNNKKIFVKTIVANLIMDFLEQNKDIIEFLEKER